MLRGNNQKFTFVSVKAEIFIRHPALKVWDGRDLQNCVESRFNESISRLELEILVTSHGINNMK